MNISRTSQREIDRLSQCFYAAIQRGDEWAERKAFTGIQTEYGVQMDEPEISWGKNPKPQEK